MVLFCDQKIHFMVLAHVLMLPRVMMLAHVLILPHVIVLAYFMRLVRVMVLNCYSLYVVCPCHEYVVEVY